MKLLLVVVRTLAVLLGLVWMAGATLDVLGILPYSQDPPPSFAHRAAHSLPLAVSGLAMALPYRFVRSPRARAIGAAALCLSIGWILFQSFAGVAAYLRGTKGWHVLPTIAALASLSLVNLWAFLVMTGGSLRKSVAGRGQAELEVP